MVHYKTHSFAQFENNFDFFHFAPLYEMFNLEIERRDGRF
jgi:hypothetical protein